MEASKSLCGPAENSPQDRLFKFQVVDYEYLFRSGVLPNRTRLTVRLGAAERNASTFQTYRSCVRARGVSRKLVEM